jgi:hypothetical protein
MDLPHNKERLLADVLANESEADFREALLSETLGLVRRRRRFRRVSRGAFALAIVAGLGVLVWRGLPPVATRPGTDSRPYALVLSRPLPSSALVITQPFAPGRIIASAPNAEVVQTASSRNIVREIDDAELLALLGPKPAALVRRGPHLAELVFVNPADEEEMVRN